MGASIPVALQLDGHCILLAEHWIGALKGYRNALGMVVFAIGKQHHFASTGSFRRT